MSNCVHYIWAGPYREQVGIEEIGNHAVQLCAMDIYLWCLTPYKSELAAKISSHGNLHIVALSPDLSGLGREEIERVQRLLGTDFRLVSAIIEHFVHNKAFSAIKDLLMLVVLYAMGGIYLDTTTQPAPSQLLATPRGQPPVRGRRYQLGLLDPAPSSSVPFFPRIGTTTLFTRPTLDKVLPSLETLYRDVTAAAHMEAIGVMTPDVDVWAAYAPLSGNEYLGVMLADYLGGCWSSGFIGAADSVLGQADKRRGPVGDLIINAVQVGLIAAQQQHHRHGRSGLSNEDAKEFGQRFTWQAVVMDPSEQGAFYVPELGIVKHHAGSWYS